MPFHTESIAIDFWPLLEQGESPTGCDGDQKPVAIPRARHGIERFGIRLNRAVVAVVAVLGGIDCSPVGAGVARLLVGHRLGAPVDRDAGIAVGRSRFDRLSLGPLASAMHLEDGRNLARGILRKGVVGPHP